jgi:hypothetical protein
MTFGGYGYYPQKITFGGTHNVSDFIIHDTSGFWVSNGDVIDNLTKLDFKLTIPGSVDPSKRGKNIYVVLYTSAYKSDSTYSNSFVAHYIGNGGGSSSTASNGGSVAT